MSIRNVATLAVASSLLVTLASAQSNDPEPRRARNNLGVKAGVYLPTDSEIRDIFGSLIFVIGLSFDDFSRQADKWRLTVDFDFITGEKDGNKFFAAPVTASIGRVFGSPEDEFRPYVRLGAGVAYFDYSITRPSTSERFSTKRGGFGADVEVGFFVGDKFRLSAKYVWFSKVDDFDFGGLQLTATYNILKF